MVGAVQAGGSPFCMKVWGFSIGATGGIETPYGMCGGNCIGGG